MPTPRLSGGRRQMLAGKKPVIVYATPDQHALIRVAAALAGQSMAAFGLESMLSAAGKITRKNKPK